MKIPINIPFVGKEEISVVTSILKNGIDDNNRIINSTSPDPFLTVSESSIFKNK